MEELAYRHLSGPLGDVLVKHSPGRLDEDDQGFFKNIELLLGPLQARAQGAYFRVAGHFFASHLGHKLRLLPAIK